jgi:hypothetical protein
MKLNNDIRNLEKKVKKFKKWARKNHPECDEQNDNGEWEYGPSFDFDDMREAAMVVIRNCDALTTEKADCSPAEFDTLVDNLLYAIARDNESEIIADELVKYPAWFQLLTERSIGSIYINAGWQFAKRIGECKECDKQLIFHFLESEDEYTSRMALGALADIYPDKAEEYAERFWNRGKYSEGTYEDEYQKIMALIVLQKVGSPKLQEYVEKALLTEYEFLTEWAEEMKGSV